jgi:16S rRNA (adenine1518-N6/adenine1519-N6)-dimethyltransferase
MALLVQKEVAERVAAGPGSMSLLSVSVQYYCEASLERVIPAELFTPKPKVDSQILKLVYRSKPLFSDVETAKFIQIVKAGFSQRRKKLRSSLSAGLHVSKEVASALLVSAGLNPDARPQELSVEDWYKLYKTHFVA